MNQFFNAPVQQTALEGYSFYIKRDDLLHPYLNGNKARKLEYFLHFHEDIKEYICYGGAQSNMLQAIAYLAHKQSVKLTYYTKNIPQHLQHNPTGNYQFALEYGANIIELGENYNNFINSIEPNKNQTLIHQGGHQSTSEYGLNKLANELIQFIEEKRLVKPKLFLPSGTGTTALYLQKSLPFPVYTVATVGKSDYLHEQFLELEQESALHPIILEAPKKFHFANLYQELIDIYQKSLAQTNIEFDLLYDTIGLLTMLKHKEDLGEELIYLHQGGLLGNVPMLERYLRREF